MEQLSFQFQLFGSVLRHFSTLISFRQQITLFLDRMEFCVRPCLCVYFHEHGSVWHALKDNGQIDVRPYGTERIVVTAEAWPQNVAPLLNVDMRISLLSLCP